MSGAAFAQRVYKYKVPGSQGTITLQQSAVHVLQKGTYGTSEETIPLALISPHYTRFAARWPGYLFVHVMGVFLVVTSPTGFLSLSPPFATAACGLAVATSAWMIWQMRRMGKLPQHTFNTTDGGTPLWYCQWGKQAEFEDFTAAVVAAIEHNPALSEETPLAESGDANGPEKVSMSYRFRTLGARGVITLLDDALEANVHTYLNRWQVNVPLEHVCPRYGRMAPGATPANLYLVGAYICLMLGLFCMIGGLNYVVVQAIGFALLTCSALIVIDVVRYRGRRWTIFTAHNGNARLAYSTNGNDVEECEAFTQAVVRAIKTAKRKDQTR